MTVHKKETAVLFFKDTQTSSGKGTRLKLPLVTYQMVNVTTDLKMC